MPEQLELHPSWPELTDRQREAVNEVWNDLVIPALGEVAVMRGERDDARIDAQDARAARRHVTQAMIDAGARAAHDITGGAIPFGGKKAKTTVSAQLMSERVLRAALAVLDAV